MTSIDRLRCRIIAATALTEAERRAWTSFTKGRERVGGAFLSWQYAEAAGRANASARIAVLEDGDGPAAFLAFQRKAGLLGQLGVAERIGGGLSDYFGLVARSSLHLTPSQLLQLSDIGAVEFSHLDESQAAFGLTGEAPRTGLRISLPEGGPAYLTELRSRKKGVVREADRRLRRLSEQVGPVQFHADLRNREDLLDTLFDAKIAQYRRTGKADGASLVERWAQALVKSLYAMDDPACRGQLSALYAGDTWVALHIGLRAGPVLHYWFPVYNHELASYGPGRLLLQMTIDKAAESGIDCIDRGEGDNPTKREYATDEHRFYRGLWVRPGLSGAVANFAQRAYWRFEASRRVHKAPGAPETPATGS